MAIDLERPAALRADVDAFAQAVARAARAIDAALHGLSVCFSTGLAILLVVFRKP